MSEKVALVCAGGSGMGAASARRLAADGYHIGVLSSSGKGEALAEELGGIGVTGSNQSNDDIERLVGLAMERWGRIDVLVNSAGHGPRAPVLELSDEDWHTGMDVYLMCAIRPSRLVTPIMIEQNGGAFVNISSMNAIEPRAPYPMSMLRATLHSFSKLYGDRYARHNIRMNNLLPGFCENVNLSESARRSIPAQRPATFEEIGQTCVFLASDEARYINGQSILSDGGMNRAVR